MTSLAMLVALVGVLAAVAFFMQVRGARAEAAARGAEVDGARAEAAAALKALAEQKAELKERREEASTLKLQLEASRKKAFEQAETQKRMGGAPALREELEKVSKRLVEARVEADHQTDVARAAEAARQKAVAEAERSRTALERKLAEPAPVAPVPPDLVEVQTRLGGELAAEKDRADKGEARAVELRKKLSEAEKELKVQKGRVETERRVYMVTKGELDLAQDRYAELKRRNDALRKEHQELIDAVRQAAREERQLGEKAGKGPAAAAVASPAAEVPVAEIPAGADPAAEPPAPTAAPETPAS